MKEEERIVNEGKVFLGAGPAQSPCLQGSPMQTSCFKLISKPGGTRMQNLNTASIRILPRTEGSNVLRS